MRATSFFSVTKFVNKLIEYDNDLLNKNNYTKYKPSIVVYFEAKDVYKNKFGLSIKPLFIKANSTPIKCIKFDKILEIFQCQPIICFKENKDRYIPAEENRKDMFSLNISLEQSEFNEIKYYPSFMLHENSGDTNIKKIRNHIIEYNKKDEEILEL